MFRAGDEVEEEEVDVASDPDAWTSYNQELFPMDGAEIMYHPEEKKLKLVGPYIMGGQLGSGSYSKVKECLHSVTLRRMAVKIMKNKNLQRISNGQKDAKKEIRLLRRLNHENVVSLEDVLYHHTKLKIYMFMEFCVGNLHELICGAPTQRLPAWQAQFYFRQLMDGLSYLHSQRVVHRDIKPMNLLLTTDDILKLSDLGIADELDWYDNSDQRVSSTPGTAVFQAPELARGDDVLYGFKLDVWASGVTLWYMLWGTSPFDVPTTAPLPEPAYQLALSQLIAKGGYVIPDGANDRLRSFIQGLMHTDKTKRLSVPEALLHAWLTVTLDRVEPAVAFTAGPGGDPMRGTTVLPFLKEYFEDQQQSDSETNESISSDVNSGSTPSSPERRYPLPPPLHVHVVNDVAFSFDSTGSVPSPSPRSGSASSFMKRFFSGVLRK